MPASEAPWKPAKPFPSLIKLSSAFLCSVVTNAFSILVVLLKISPAKGFSLSVVKSSTLFVKYGSKAFVFGLMPEVP